MTWQSTRRRISSAWCAKTTFASFACSLPIFSARCKSVTVTASQVEKALKNDCRFDGSSIEGFTRIEESDMCLDPDPDSFCILPWSEQGQVARLICDVYTTDGRPFEGNPRYVLERVLERARKMGYEFYVGPELEFFLFHTDDDRQGDHTHL